MTVSMPEAGFTPRSVAGHYKRALQRAARKDYPGALADLDEVLRLQPDNATAYFHRGVIRADTGDETNAVENLNQAIRIDEHYADAFAALANLHMRHERYAEAVLNADKAIEFSPQNL